MDELSVSVVDAGLLQDLRDQFDQVIGSVRSARFFTSVPADMAQGLPRCFSPASSWEGQKALGLRW